MNLIVYVFDDIILKTLLTTNICNRINECLSNIYNILDTLYYTY